MVDFYGLKGTLSWTYVSYYKSIGQYDGRGISKMVFLGHNYGATIWPIELIFFGTHLQIISSYWVIFNV